MDYDGFQDWIKPRGVCPFAEPGLTSAPELAYLQDVPKTVPTAMAAGG